MVKIGDNLKKLVWCSLWNFIDESPESFIWNFCKDPFQFYIEDSLRNFLEDSLSYSLEDNLKEPLEWRICNG